VPTTGPLVTRVESRAYSILTDQAEADGTLAWSSTTVVVAQVVAGDVTGTGWTYGSKGCQAVIDGEIARAITGANPEDVPGLHEAMVRACRNLGRPGLAGYAISAVDIALWDLKARLMGVSLTSLFGRCREAVPIYGSGGFTTYDDQTTVSQLEYWVKDLEVAAVKIKIGEDWGGRMERDMARVELARQTVGEGVELMVDANGGYRRKQAVRMGRRLAADHGVDWFEEPVSSDDLTGLREVREQAPLDIAAGEYGFDEPYFARMVEAGAVDCLQIDVTRCGGYTAWQRIAALAAAHNLDVSGHCAPHLHSHVAASVPNLRHVEYFHDHARADPMLFDGLPAACGGVVSASGDSIGHGMTLREGDGEVFRVG
jgi:L-alanine-DL-glutamate epimerase-like enolase superfamily enzyme